MLFFYDWNHRFLGYLLELICKPEFGVRFLTKKCSHKDNRSDQILKTLKRLSFLHSISLKWPKRPHRVWPLEPHYPTTLSIAHTCQPHPGLLAVPQPCPQTHLRSFLLPLPGMFLPQRTWAPISVQTPSYQRGCPWLPFIKEEFPFPPHPGFTVTTFLIIYSL